MSDVTRRTAAFVLLALLAAPALPAVAQLRGQPVGELSDLTIESGDKRHRFKVELADTDEKRTIGLMFRNALAPDGGMLFDFKRDAPVSMWMRNTLIPLDMLFIARDGRVVNIAQRAIPHDETPIYSSGPVRAVLELAGGTAQRLGLKAGDRVVHAMFAAR